MKCPMSAANPYVFDHGLMECDPECACLLVTKTADGEPCGKVCAFASIGSECENKLSTVARLIPCGDTLKDDEVIEG